MKIGKVKKGTVEEWCVYEKREEKRVAKREEQKNKRRPRTALFCVCAFPDVFFSSL